MTPAPHTHEIGMRLGRVTLADDVIELYRCRHCPRRLVKPQDRQALEELGDVSLCHCAGTPRQKRC